MPPVRLGSSASPSRPRSQKLWTFVVRPLNTVGVGSARLSKTLIVPLFSATKTRPSAANRIAVGLTRPDQTVVSWNPAGMAASTAGSVAGSWRAARVLARRAFAEEPFWQCAARLRRRGRLGAGNPRSGPPNVAHDDERNCHRRPSRGPITERTCDTPNARSTDVNEGGLRRRDLRDVPPPSRLARAPNYRTFGVRRASLGDPGPRKAGRRWFRQIPLKCRLVSGNDPNREVLRTVPVRCLARFAPDAEMTRI